MRYDPPKLGAGYGLKAGVYDDAEQVERKVLDGLGSGGSCASSESPCREVCNVFDYDGCCLFSFIFVGYVSTTLCVVLW